MVCLFLLYMLPCILTAVNADHKCALSSCPAKLCAGPLTYKLSTLQILWTYILSQAAAAVVQQPVVKGEEEQVISIPQQIAIAITEEEQIAAMAMVVEELTSTSEEPASEQDGATPATA